MTSVTSFIFDQALLPDGWARHVRVEVAGGTIARVQGDATDRQSAAVVAGIAVPGLPNLHCHSFQRAMAGLAERRGPTNDSFWTWREVMYGFLGALNPDDVEAIAAFATMEMLEAGFTAGGGVSLLQQFTPGRPSPDTGQRRAAV